MDGPLPGQVCTWLPTRSGFGAAEPKAPEGASGGEWLYCLKFTEPGDRQVVWSGVDGLGIVAVVDFCGAVRPRSSNPSRYEGWGRLTYLPRAVSVQTAQEHLVLQRCFDRSIQSVQAIDSEVARAISQCAGGMPPAADFEGHEPDWSEHGGDWRGRRLPLEAIAERMVLDEDRVARQVGFASTVNPGGSKQRLGNGGIPDFWCAQGVVGDAKNQVNAKWGPDQLEGYIEQCDAEWPSHRWRGVLVQGEPEMAPNALPCLRESRYADRIEVWAVSKSRLRTEAIRLFP